MASEVTRRRFLGAAGTIAAVGAGTATGLGADSAEAAEAKKIKILGICGSPRQGKTTATALQACLAAAKEVADCIETELLELAGLNINGAVAAGIELPPGQTDDFPALLPKLTDPALGGVIMGTPVYFGSMTSLCKAFLERCMELRKTDAWANKAAGVLAVGGARNGGQELTIQSVQSALFCHQMLLVGDGKPTGHRGGTLWSGCPGGITADEFGMSTAANLGRRVAEVALLARG
ncbi:MAG: NAD(P)H-dependent oxidoreductase [Pirellulales bacterium]|nr:NAD(P)H-dependent oxidoreductase [Pirellulales bacterium]